MSDKPSWKCKTQRRGREPLDLQFDRLVPRDLRHLSSSHWTPVQVAVRAATLLCPTPKARVLDVGSGIGKLCSIGALATFGTWVGVEQHEPLVATAKNLARALGVGDRTHFIGGDAFAVEWDEFDALYFYNPFELTLFGENSHEQRRLCEIANVQSRLARLAKGTRVVTFHGFGGVMPPTFELLYHERVSGHDLDLTLWIQRTHCVIGGNSS